MISLKSGNPCPDTPGTGTLISPDVTLSPNARNEVLVRVGTSVSETGKAHDPERLPASVAVHETVVVPIGNIDPDGGEQATVTGS
jgi:hypothetical protein